MSVITEKLRGNWNQVKGKLKEEYGELTDNDLIYQEGQEEKLIGLIQEKTGEAKEKIKAFIDQI